MKRLGKVNKHMVPLDCHAFPLESQLIEPEHRGMLDRQEVAGRGFQTEK